VGAIVLRFPGARKHCPAHAGGGQSGEGGQRHVTRDAALQTRKVISLKTRLGTVLLAVAAISPIMLVAAAGPAVAGSKPTISCTISGSATISPGITGTPAIQTLTVTTSLSGCTKSSVAGITSSSPTTTSSTGTSTETCANLTEKSKPVTTDSSINWNNGDTSTDTYSTTLDKGKGKVKGSITAGTFDGGKIKASLTYTIGAGENCTTAHPVDSATITGTFKIS
jgi:hypothetical protein